MISMPYWVGNGLEKKKKSKLQFLLKLYKIQQFDWFPIWTAIMYTVPVLHPEQDVDPVVAAQVPGEQS